MESQGEEFTVISFQKNSTFGHESKNEESFPVGKAEKDLHMGKALCILCDQGMYENDSVILLLHLSVITV